MDKEGLAALATFKLALESRLSSFFKARGFIHIKSTIFDNGNIVEVEYCCDEIMLKFYRSLRDGEINCMARRSFKDSDIDQGQAWLYINSLLIDQNDYSIDELLTRMPDKIVGDDEQISAIANLLEDNFHTLQHKIARIEDHT